MSSDVQGLLKVLADQLSSVKQQVRGGGAGAGSAAAGGGAASGAAAATSSAGAGAGGGAAAPSAAGARSSAAGSSAAGAAAAIDLGREIEEVLRNPDAFNMDEELKNLEELTRKLTAGEYNDGSDGSASDEEDDDEDDEEFSRQLLGEFRSMLQLDTKASEVPKARVKELYLQMMARGAEILQDKHRADAFLNQMTPAEMAALMDVVSKTQEQALQYFDGDPDVAEAIRRAPSAPLTSFFEGQSGRRKAKKGTFAVGDLAAGDDDEDGDATDDSDRDELDDAAFAAAKRAAASPAVLKALQTFEGNLVHYAQHPDELLRLSNSLPTTKDQNDFLDILFTEYTPEKMQEQVARRQQQRQPQGAAALTAAEIAAQITDLNQVVNPDLVAVVFREVLSKFSLYKRAPHKFDALVSRMGPLEQQAFEALVKAFWDVKPEDLRL